MLKGDFLRYQSWQDEVKPTGTTNIQNHVMVARRGEKLIFATPWEKLKNESFCYEYFYVSYDASNNCRERKGYTSVTWQ